MTLAELRAKLAGLKPGQMVAVHHDVYARLFPPGEPDERAREECYKFAKAAGCRIEIWLREKMVRFIKDADGARSRAQ